MEKTNFETIREMSIEEMAANLLEIVAALTDDRSTSLEYMKWWLSLPAERPLVPAKEN